MTIKVALIASVCLKITTMFLANFTVKLLSYELRAVIKTLLVKVIDNIVIKFSLTYG